MDRSDSSRTPRSRTVVEGRIRAPQTLSSEMSGCIHRLRVAHHRKSVFSGLRRSNLIFSIINRLETYISIKQSDGTQLLKLLVAMRSVVPYITQVNVANARLEQLFNIS